MTNIADLRKELEECEADMETCSQHNIELQQEIAKLRAAVPEDVKEELNIFSHLCANYGFVGQQDEGLALKHAEDKREEILALIGALIERSREVRKKDIVAAYKAGWDESFGKPEDKSEAYAERILGEGK